MNTEDANHGTVFISSRMEETGASRRAAFDGVIDAGLTPLIFESMPTSWSERLLERDAAGRKRRATDDEERTLFNALRFDERETIDGLISNSELFVGIYADTLGYPVFSLCELPAIEYEFLRFMELWKLREQGASRTAIDCRMETLFPSIDGRTLVPKAASPDVVQVKKDIDNAVSYLSSFYEAPDYRWQEHPRDMPSIQPGNYAHVFHHRAILFHKQYSSDRPIAAALFAWLKRKPHWPYQLSRGDKDDSRPVFFPATTDLHARVYHWAKNIASRQPFHSEVAPKEVRHLFLLIDRTEDHPGYLRAVCEEVFACGFNVDFIELGLMSGARVIAASLTSYHGSTAPAELEARKDLLTDRLNKGLGAVHKVVRTKYKVDATEEPRVILEYDWPGRKRYCDLVSLPRRNAKIKKHKGETHVVKAIVANIPGILYRAVERIAARNGSVLRIDVDNLRGKERTRKGLEICFRFVDSVNPSAEADLVTYITAELRFLVGMYHVFVLPIETKGKR